MTSQFDRRSVLGWAATVAGVGISAISATPIGGVIISNCGMLSDTPAYTSGSYQ